MSEASGLRCARLREPARRRRALAAALATGLALAPLLGPGRTLAGERSGATTEAERRLDAGRREAVKRGCAWIATKQEPRGNGAFGDNKAVVAFTALSALALMADGSSVGRGPYGEQVRKAIEFLVGLVEKPSGQAMSNSDGYFAYDQDINSKMHGQGYATLALASALGSADKGLAQRIRAVLVKAVLVCEESQTGTGGWGYLPTRGTEHEGSVTVTVAQGLRAARDAGITVSGEMIRRGLMYLEHSQKKTDDDDDGSFKYSLMTERSTYALTAAAVSSYNLFGVYEYGKTDDEKDRIARGVRYIKRKLREVMKTHEWFYYGNFYAAWAAWQKDGDQPEPVAGQSFGSDPMSRDIERTTQFWGPWHAKVYPYLLAQQQSDGHWSEEHGEDRFSFGDLLPTTFAVLTLAIPDEMIPIFQR